MRLIPLIAFLLLISSSFAYNNNTDAAFTLDLTGNLALKLGVKIQATNDTSIISVVKTTASTATTAYIYDTTPTLLGTATFVGNFANFSGSGVAIVNGSSYWVEADAGGAAYDYTYNTLGPGYPLTSIDLDFIDGAVSEGSNTNEYNVLSILTNTSFCTPIINISQSSMPVDINCAGSTYNLKEDINIATTAFTITASNTTLNCEGHLVNGTNASDTYGIYTNQDYTQIQNCNIQNFQDGIRFNVSKYGKIVNTNTSSTNSGDGIRTGVGLVLYNGANSNTITNAISSSFSSTGTYLYSSDNNTFNNFITTSTSGYGAWLETSTLNNFTNFNSSTANAVSIYLSANADYNRFVNTTSYSPNAYGIGTSDSQTIINSTMVSLNSYGVQTGANWLVNNSRIYSNASNALYVGGNANVITESLISSNATSSGAGTGYSLLVAATTDNEFYWNNFTSPNPLNRYVYDIGTNFYNNSTKGNIWGNVISGAVSIVGNNVSTRFPNMFIGVSGTGYPYNNSTSQGYFRSTCLTCGDFAPLVQFIGNLTNCDLTSTIQILNFSYYDQISPSTNINGTMDATFFITTPAGITQNFSFNFSNFQASHAICLNASGTFYIDSIQQYRSPGYRNLYYYLRNQTVVLPGRYNVSLYQINTTGSATTRFSILSQANQPQIGAYLQIYRYYPATNQFLLASMGKTDTNGFAESYVIPNEVVYRYVVIEGYGIAFTSNSATLPCDPGLTLCSTTILFNNQIQNEYVAFANGVGYGCIVNPTHTLISCSSINPSGTGTNLVLNVYEVGTYTNPLNCTNSISSGSGSVSCAINPAKAYYYVATSTIGSDVVIGSGSVGTTAGSAPGAVLGAEFGALAGIGMIVALAAIGALGGFSAAIIMAIIGLILATLIGLLTVGLGALAAIVAVGLALAFILRQ